MPKATTNTEETIRHELESLPDGFVELRKLTYGEMLRRRDLVMKITTGVGDNPEFKMTNLDVTLFEFSKCIVDHNLEDGDGRKLDLTKEKDIVQLDPRIAGEIEIQIDKLNQPPAEEVSKSV